VILKFYAIGKRLNIKITGTFSMEFDEVVRKTKDDNIIFICLNFGKVIIYVERVAI